MEIRRIPIRKQALAGVRGHRGRNGKEEAKRRGIIFQRKVQNGKQNKGRFQMN